MLRVWGLPQARPTMDIDLLRRGAADQQTLRDLVARCAAIQDAGDVVEFDQSTIVAEAITEEAEYVGTRFRLTARMGNVRQRVQIDFGVGDAVVPDPVKIEFPLMLGGESIRLTAYPVEAADLRNSRMKDYYDIWMLSRNCSFTSTQLSSAIRSTFERRGTPLPSTTPPALTEAFHGDPAHVRQWTAFVKRIGDIELTGAFAEIVTDVAGSVAPIVWAGHAERPPRIWQRGGPWKEIQSEDRPSTA